MKNSDNISIEIRKRNTYTVHRQLSPIPHIHSDIELIYVKSGSSTCYNDVNAFNVSTGDIFIAFPNQIHYYLNSEYGEYYVFIFSSDTIYGMGELFRDNVPECNVISGASSDIIELFDKIVHTEGEYANTYKAGYINQLMAKLMSEFNLVPRIASNNTTLHNILNFCEENYTDDITIDDIADALHFSKYYISRLFNKKIMISFKTYINNLRVKKACDMLKQSDEKISYIANESGFGSIRSFNRAFEQIMNMTPAQYRKLYESELKTL